MQRDIIGEVKKHIKKKYQIISITGVIALGMISGIAYLYYFYDTAGGVERHVWSVELTQTGFFPQTLTIAKGDSVTFTSSRSQPFWPASDLHPTHEIYGEFDPKQPIEAGGSWSFRFDKAGKWRFHDHLNSLFRGTIVVKDASSNAGFSDIADAQTLEKCALKSDYAKKLICWRDAVDGALSSKGVAAAFEIVASLSATYPEFPGQCHGFAHLIGQSASKIFQEGKKIEITPQASYCGYGFYHAFLETLLQNGGTIEQARELCEEADREYALRVAQADGPLRACYHGIGHGITDGSDSRTWGNAQAMIEPALKVCEQFGDTEFKKDLCASGAFNSLAIMYQNPRYRLKIENNNPYHVCQNQKKSYFKKSCYEEMNTLALNSMGGDFNKAVKLVDQIEERDYAIYAMQGLASYAASFALRENTYKNFIASCRVLRADIRNECIGGFVGGLFEFGSIGKEYKGAIEFCASGLTEEEKRICYGSVIGYGSYMYSKEKMDIACEAIEPTYQYVCRKS